MRISHRIQGFFALSIFFFVGLAFFVYGAMIRLFGEENLLSGIYFMILGLGILFISWWLFSFHNFRFFRDVKIYRRTRRIRKSKKLHKI